MALEPTGSSHLIERAAERLRREGVASGAIDGSAAHLLDTGATLQGRPLIPAPAELETDEAASGPAHAAANAVAAPTAIPNGAVPTGDMAKGVTSNGVVASAVAANGVAANGVLLNGALPNGAVHARAPIGIDRLTRAGMIDWANTRTRISEEFRVIQAQVLRNAFPGMQVQPRLIGAGSAMSPNGLATSPGGNLVMITSARPGEGKSFSSLNLAASIARQRDRDVLLVDMDAKIHSMGSLLGLDEQPGLLELASDPRLDPQTLVWPTAIPNLSVLGFGTAPDGAELVASRKMARVIRDLGRRFADRLVILDAPPCLSSSDASAVAPIVSQVVFVVEAEQTQRAEVETALDLIQACPTITLLLNKVQLRTRHSFGGYASRYASRYTAD